MRAAPRVCAPSPRRGRFLTEFGNTGSMAELSLDTAAQRLNVERRRIYDIVNIFESLDIVKRKGKNKYTWLGTEGVSGEGGGRLCSLSLSLCA